VRRALESASMINGRQAQERRRKIGFDCRLLVATGLGSLPATSRLCFSRGLLSAGLWKWTLSDVCTPPPPNNLGRSQKQKWELASACLENMYLWICGLWPEALPTLDPAKAPGLATMLDMLGKEARKLLAVYGEIEQVDAAHIGVSVWSTCQASCRSGAASLLWCCDTCQVSTRGCDPCWACCSWALKACRRSARSLTTAAHAKLRFWWACGSFARLLRGTPSLSRRFGVQTAVSSFGHAELRLPLSVHRKQRH
jgi:hypothetical protein